MNLNRYQTKWFFLVTSLLSILSLVGLLIIPREPNNLFVLGYSLPRFGLLLFNFLISTLLIAVTILLWGNTSAGEKLQTFFQAWLKDGRNARFLQVVVVIGVAACSFLLVELLFTDNKFLEGILFRLSPLLGFITLTLLHLDYLISRTARQQDQQIKTTIQIHVIVFIWILLSVLWFLGTINSLVDILIFKRLVILLVSIYILILFSLDHFLTSDRLSRGVLAVSLLMVMMLSLWITNRFNEFSEYAIVTMLLTPTFCIQFIFLGFILFMDKVKQNLTVGKSTINIKIITIWLGGIATVLVLIALFFQISGIMGISNSFRNVEDVFFLDREMNVPAIFSSLLLLIAAGWLLFVFRIRKKTRGPYTWHWGFLGVVFIILSLDELFSFHESLIGPVRRIVDLGGIFSYEWIIIAIPLVLILGISYLRFFFHLQTDIRILFFLAAALFLGGSIGGEMLSGWYASKFGEGGANYISLTIFEETLEMSGIIIFIHAIMFYLYKVGGGHLKSTDKSKNLKKSIIR